MLSVINVFALQWELVHQVTLKAGTVVSVLYITASTSCNISYKVNGILGVATLCFYLFHGNLSFQCQSCPNVRVCHIDPVPAFELEANRLSKSFNVILGAGDSPVYARCCYRNGYLCKSIQESPLKHVGATCTLTCVKNKPKHSFY